MYVNQSNGKGSMLPSYIQQYNYTGYGMTVTIIPINEYSGIVKYKERFSRSSEKISKLNTAQDQSSL